jgi:hypothetical protein
VRDSAIVCQRFSDPVKRTDLSMELHFLYNELPVVVAPGTFGRRLQGVRMTDARTFVRCFGGSRIRSLPLWLARMATVGKHRYSPRDVSRYETEPPHVFVAHAPF